MHAMMQTRMQKVEKFFVFFSTKLGLLHFVEENSGAREFLIFEKNNSGATSLQEVFISSIFTFPGLILQFFVFVFQESNMVGLQANTLGAGTWLEGWHFNQGPN